jgi:voltage-gated potassium channel
VSSPETTPLDGSAGPRPDKSDIAAALLGTIIRVVITFVMIAVILSLAPDVPDGRFIMPIILVFGMAGLYVWYFRRQLKSVYTAKFPTLRAVESIVAVAAMFLGTFALFYVMISVNDRTAFTEPLDAFSGYYFSLTVLATVGFGDITPVTTLARSVTMVQMALDLAFIGVAFKVIGGTARRALKTRKQSRDETPTTEAVED